MHRGKQGDASMKPYATFPKERGSGNGYLPAAWGESARDASAELAGEFG
jgi:hypothetical protein